MYDMFKLHKFIGRVVLVLIPLVIIGLFAAHLFHAGHPVLGSLVGLAGWLILAIAAALVIGRGSKEMHSTPHNAKERHLVLSSGTPPERNPWWSEIEQDRRWYNRS
jgi:hypothetical protein